MIGREGIHESRRMALRGCALFVGITILAAALIGGGTTVYGGNLSPAVVQDRTPRTPPDDVRLPEPSPITSPGFPSDLTGKCVTMQGCLEYCKAHPADPACDRFLNKPNVDK
jgi:hypothetical protein